jgi:hypothetical protein
MIYFSISFVLISIDTSACILIEADCISALCIQIHCPSKPDFDFHKYMMRALEHEFKRVVGIRLVSSEKRSMFA